MFRSREYATICVVCDGIPGVCSIVRSIVTRLRSRSHWSTSIVCERSGGLCFWQEQLFCGNNYARTRGAHFESWRKERPDCVRGHHLGLIRLSEGGGRFATLA